MAVKTLFEKLAEPFSDEELEWRVQQIGKTESGRIWAIVVPYVQSRAIMQRLDDVLTPQFWQTKFDPTGTVNGDGIQSSGFLGGLGIWDQHEQRWVWKFDGAQATNIEAIKGGISGALKRAAVQWGIGRYLYDFDTVFVDVTDNSDGSNKPPKDMKVIFVNQREDAAKHKIGVKGWALCPLQDGRGASSPPQTNPSQAPSTGGSSSGSDERKVIPAKWPTDCTACNKKHPVGTPITPYGENDKGGAGWAAVACVDKLASVKRSEGEDKSGTLHGTIEDLENKFRNSGGSDDDIMEMRLSRTGKKALNEASHTALMSYKDHLATL